jgi:hypothetical protein
VTKIRKDAQGDGAKETALLEGFQHLMGWRSPETMVTYTKTMNKREAIKAILEDEEEQECTSQSVQTRTSQRQKETQYPKDEQSSDTTEKRSPLPDAHDEFDWYEEED